MVGFMNEGILLLLELDDWCSVYYDNELVTENHGFEPDFVFPYLEGKWVGEYLTLRTDEDRYASKKVSEPVCTKYPDMCEDMSWQGEVEPPLFNMFPKQFTEEQWDFLTRLARE